MKARIKTYNAGQTYFVVLKNRTSISGFYDDSCYQYYLLRLLNCLNIYQVKLHAYLLQSQEIWLLVTPGTPTGLDGLLRFLNQSYSEYFNTRFSRFVKVWSDAAISCEISGAQLALDCQKFIEREPLRANLVSHPGEYLWSSYCANSFSRNTNYLVAHGGYRNFLRGKRNCFSQYREFVASPYLDAYYLFLASRLLYGVPMGNKRGSMHSKAHSKTNAKTGLSLAIDRENECRDSA